MNTILFSRLVKLDVTESILIAKGIRIRKHLLDILIKSILVLGTLLAIVPFHCRVLLITQNIVLVFWIQNKSFYTF